MQHIERLEKRRAGPTLSRQWRPSKGFNPHVKSTSDYPGYHEFFHGSRNPLSNFFPCTLSFRGTKYRSSEHAYQCMKARCAQKPDLEMKIYSQFTAREAKLLGNTLSMSLDGHCNWMKKRVAVMKEILEHKFAQVPQFRVALKTGFTYVEDTSDEFWGYGLTPRKVKTGLPQDYPGRNVMGCLLT